MENNKMSDERINEIIDIIYNKYIDQNQLFDLKSFKKENIDLYNEIISKFDNINNFYIYASLIKQNNKFITKLNDLKNYLILSYIEKSRMNGLLFMDLIEDTDFNVYDIKTLYNILKDIYNKNDLVE